MAEDVEHGQAGDDLVKQNLITREELEDARKREAASGTPWYRQLIHKGLVSFEAVENVLRYEFHPKSLRVEQENLGDTLVAMGALSQDQLGSALEEQRRTGRLLGVILQEQQYVTADAIAKALARQYGLDFAPIEDTPSDAEALDAVSEHIAQKNEFVPISIEQDKLDVLIASPQHRRRLEDVSVLLGLRIHPRLTATSDIQQEITLRYDELRELDDDLPGATPSRQSAAKAPQQAAPSKPPTKNARQADPEAHKKDESMAPIEEDVEFEENVVDTKRFDDIARQASGTSVIKIVSTIIEGAVNSGATDVHLDPQEPEMRVRYRIDGVLHDVMSIPVNLEAAVVSRIKIMADLDITDTRHPHDGHISTEVGDREFDIRVATLPTFLGERVVLRLLDQTAVLSGIKDLGMEKDDEDKLIRLIDQPYGMILVTGPTGSGKTTTLYASLNQKNVMTDSIVTLEDPVEYQLSGINQVQIDTDINMTFASTLRAALRQDIDVLLVGEIRDAETARIAVRAAMTGHLVFSTLHTNDAPEAIDTLRNMDVPSYLIASALTAVIGQRLVRTICENCRKGFKPSATLLKSIQLPATTKQLYRGAGCELCYHTGNRGRTGIFEILEITPEIRKLIAEDGGMAAIVKAAKLKTMAMRCREKVKKGIVEPEEFLRVIRT